MLVLQTNKVFLRYMRLVRRLQTTYRMEPAGSQGVWSLDDYQFVAFIWGAAQVRNHNRLTPSSIPDQDMAAGFKNDYHLFACIDYIYQAGEIPKQCPVSVFLVC